MNRRDFLTRSTAISAAVAAPSIWSPAKAQARAETLLIVSESGPNNLDVHGVGAANTGAAGPASTPDSASRPGTRPAAC